MNGTPESAQRRIEAAQAHLEKGEPLLAYNETQAGLSEWPEHPRLRQLQALALARSGDTARANALLAVLARDGLDDAETLGMLARTHKDLALVSADSSARSSHLEAAFDLYEKAYDAARERRDADGAGYTGINAATLALLRGDLPRARAIANEVRQFTSDAARSYWQEATLGEAALVLGEAEAAQRHYAAAAALSRGRYGDLSSTRRQARLLASHLGGSLDVERLLAIPPVAIFTGHMVDAVDRAAPRFPARIEGAVREALSRELDTAAPVALYGSAACGADLLCLELAQERRIETHVVLPFPATEFRRTSVEFAGGAWSERFDRAIANAASVTVTSDHHARGSSATYEYANLVLTGMGRLRAQTLDTPLVAIAAWDRGQPGADGGSASIATLWEQQGLAVRHVPIDALRGGGTPPAAAPAKTAPAPDAAVRHEIRAMLFADAVGYSKLGEDQIPGYIQGFLGAVGELSRRTTHRYEHVETSGDGLYMVFRDAGAAGRFALELSALTNAFDRAAWGLPETFSLRVALHCGPVHCARDPITGGPIYTGPHTSRAARIEPVTPPGQVYASSAFAAVAAASGAGFAMSYVGRMPLAKGYGSLGLYHVRGEAGRIPS